MKSIDFQKLHTDSDNASKLGVELNKIISSVIRSKADNPSYLAWVTEYAHIDGNAQSIKRIQNRINKSATQRLVFGLTAKESLTQRTSLVKASKPLTKAGHFTESELARNPKPYKFITTNVTVSERTAKEQAQKVVKEFGLTKAQMTKVINVLDY
jgi:hypothetical protein